MYEHVKQIYVQEHCYMPEGTFDGPSIRLPDISKVLSA